MDTKEFLKELGNYTREDAYGRALEGAIELASIVYEEDESPELNIAMMQDALSVYNISADHRLAIAMFIMREL